MVSRWLSLGLSDCLSVTHPSVFLFPVDNSSECQWIFTKFGMCNDIVEI